MYIKINRQIMNPVVHFEMPADDRERMADFYTKVFGWKTQFFGEEMGNYVTVTTSETDVNGRPVKPGTINGGFYPKSADMADQHPSVVIGVGNIHESIKKVTEAGGKVLGEPAHIPQVGDYVSFIDTEGNRVSLLQPYM
jgi:predicted enzyme related to lactoylglutathione lyase